MAEDSNVPTLDEVLEVVTPSELVFGLVLQLRNWLPHDVRKQIDETSPRVHLCAICWKWETMLSNLKQSDAQAPDIARDCVALTRDSLRCHVVTRADESVRVALGAKLATNTKITKLYLSLASEQNIRRLDVSMYNAVAVKVGQAIQHSFCDFAQNLFPSPPSQLLHLSVDTIQRTAFAEFHTDAYRAAGIVHEGAVVLANVFGRAGLVEG